MFSAGDISICKERYGDTSLKQDCEEYVKRCHELAKAGKKPFILVIKGDAEKKLFSVNEKMCLQHAVIAPRLQQSKAPQAKSEKSKKVKPTPITAPSGNKTLFSFDDLGFNPQKEKQELTLVFQKNGKYFVSKISVSLKPKNEKQETPYILFSESGKKIGEGSFRLSEKNTGTFHFEVITSPKNPTEVLRARIISK